MSTAAMLFIPGASVAVVVLAARLRGRGFALFIGVLLTLHGLGVAGLWSTWEAMGLMPLAAALQVTVYVHVLSLMMPALRPLPWRALVSWPSQWFVASSFMALPWALSAVVFGVAPLWWLPYVAGLFGLGQSLYTRRDEVDLVLDGTDVPGLSRRAHGEGRVARPLRVVQISDPHLGPFMSVSRLQAIARRAVEDDPDLVLLTGDYLTMESKGSPGCLAEALAPLRGLGEQGRVYACFGNHDLEAPHMVARELAACGIRLLVDDAALVDTPAGPVQVVGANFRWRDRSEHLAALTEAHPRIDGALRILLLHDPGAFAHLPEGGADLVLSGHTHGGHVGLLSLGSRWTFIGGLSRMPDHGFWSRGTERLYVHRATGHYGFPIRVGVPSEEGLMRIHALGR